MRRVSCVGFTFCLCLWFAILELQEPSNWYAAYTKQVRFGGLGFLDVLSASSK